MPAPSPGVYNFPVRSYPLHTMILALPVVTVIYRWGWINTYQLQIQQIQHTNQMSNGSNLHQQIESEEDEEEMPEIVSDTSDDEEEMPIHQLSDLSRFRFRFDFPLAG